MDADESAKGKRDDLDGVVQRTLETFLDSSPGDNRTDLADSLSGDIGHVRFRLCAVVPSKAVLDRGPAVRHQPRRQHRVHTNSVWPA